MLFLKISFPQRLIIDTKKERKTAYVLHLLSAVLGKPEKERYSDTTIPRYRAG